MATSKQSKATKATPKAKANPRRDRNRAPSVALPEGVDVELEALTTGLAPEGFLVRPTEEHPTPTSFVGVLRAMQEKAPKKRGERTAVWGVFEAIGDQDTSFIFDRDTGETSEIEDGMMVGISRIGALHGMTEAKIGHLFVFEFTGETIQLDPEGKQSPMWEVLSQVSKKPYER